MASELQELLRRIEQEHQAMQRGLVGLASVARHEFTRRKYASIDREFVKVVELVGTDKACDLVVGIMDKPVEEVQVGNILVYHLRPDQMPTNDQPWYGRVTHLLPETHQLFNPSPKTNLTHFWIKCLDTAYRGGEELVSGSQVINVLTQEEFDVGVRDGTILLHQ